jgi:endonuclease YncB( thermonuclease family)
MRLLLTLLLAFPQTIGLADTPKGRVVHVTAGDPIMVLNANDAQHKIRLQGIDAPEREGRHTVRNRKNTCLTRLPVSS